MSTSTQLRTGSTVIGGTPRALATLGEEAARYDQYVAAVYFNKLLLAWNPLPVWAWDAGSGSSTPIGRRALSSVKAQLYAHAMFHPRATVYADHPDFSLVGTDAFGVHEWDSEFVVVVATRVRDGRLILIPT